MERYKGKKVLIVGVGQTGFALINFFNKLECDIRVTDIQPIFNLNKSVKKLKKINPVPKTTFGEHRDEDFVAADVIVYSSSVHPSLPQLSLAREASKIVLSEFELANQICDKPIIAVCGSHGRTTVAHMIGYALKLEGKNVFVGGTSDNPFINFFQESNYHEMDYVIVEVRATQLQGAMRFSPILVVYTTISEEFDNTRFHDYGNYLATKLSVAEHLPENGYLIVNFDKLSRYSFFRNQKVRTYWYSRQSFVKIGMINEIEGTHFHEKRICSNIHHYSELRVSKMRIVGAKNRENLLAAITSCKALDVSDKAIQELIISFPGIPHHLEYVTRKNGVSFYNDSKSENMDKMFDSVKSFRTPVILIAGGKNSEQNYELFANKFDTKIRVMILVGECKEKMNRVFGNLTQTYLVGSFEESILLAYQKSRTGDTILLSPGNPATDIFRDYKERGNYYKKLIYQF